MPERVERVKAYHKATKHHFERFAKGPGFMDWASQPKPFRRWFGASLVHLDRIPPGDDPPYDRVFRKGGIPSAPLTFRNLSQLLCDSLALSAWKRAGASKWALRVNPSSGNLHPTEGYVICGPMPETGGEAAIAHYAPEEHALEIRARLPGPIWRKLTEGFPQGVVFVGLTSIYWKEAWKYGERAYRYCALDAGHAQAAVAVAAAGLGWESRQVYGLETDEIARLLGVIDPQGAEPEQPDCLMAVFPGTFEPIEKPVAISLETFDPAALSWMGKPNSLSPTHVRWSAIEEAAKACSKRSDPSESPDEERPATEQPAEPGFERPIALRRIIHRRRSALAMDGVTTMRRDVFYRLLERTLPFRDRAPFSLPGRKPNVHPALFVHRVEGAPPGIYLLVRDPSQHNRLREAMDSRFAWKKPEGCPDRLGLYLLAAGDVRAPARQLSCFQDIAGDGCFCAAMISEFKEPLERYGAWFYPELHRECGMIGQMLYLEAEAAGLRGTGIGCFFDDPTCELLGLRGDAYQDLYHFTVGGPVDDPRLTTLPPYPDVVDS